jgi:hypothetical protein
VTVDANLVSCEIAPHVFHRIGLWRVGGKPLQQVASASALHVILHQPVAPFPSHDSASPPTRTIIVIALVQETGACRYCLLPCCLIMIPPNAMLVKINASISDVAELIQKLDGLTATLWDADPISDDLLATAVLSRGKAEFLIHLEDALSLDSLLETKPDLFITVADTGGAVVFRSKIHTDIDFSHRDPVSNDAITTLDLVFSRPK